MLFQGYRMLIIDLKKTSHVSFRSPLGKYIASKYSQDASDFDADLKALDDLRTECTGQEVSMQAVNKCWKYYGQLNFVQSRFLIDEYNVKVSFPWGMVFPKEKKTISSYSLNFERACILFNIAVIYSQLGAANLRNSEGLKKCCSYFMTAAGLFNFISETYASSLNIPANTDLCPVALKCFSKLMLAQAQECVVQKAIIDGMKDAAISKLSASCGELFSAAFDDVCDSVIGELMGTAWLNLIQAKMLYFYALAQYHKSLECCPQGKYGEEIVRLRQAVDYLENIGRMSKQLPASFLGDVKASEEIIKKNLNRATKDNDLIYHAPLPKPETLASVGRAEMVKATPPPDMAALTDVIGPPLFSSLVPLHIKQLISSYCEKRDKTVSQVSEEISKNIERINTFLADNNLPGSIEAAEKPIGLPGTVLKKANEVRSAGGSDSLSASLMTLETLRKKASNSLQEILDILEKEEKQDEAARQKYGAKWKPESSRKLNLELFKNFNSLKAAFEQAKKSDELVQERYQQHLPYIESLSSSDEELNAIIPASSTQSRVSYESLPQLKAMLQELEEQKDLLANNLKRLKEQSENDDPTKAFLATTATDNRDEIMEESLKKYSQYQESVVDAAKKLVPIFERIKEANLKFIHECSNSASFKQREVALQNLDNAYNNFKVLNENFSEGTKFYTDLQSHLKELKKECVDYTSSRNLEFEDWSKELESVTKSFQAASISPNSGQPPLPPKHPAQASSQQQPPYMMPQQPYPSGMPQYGMMPQPAYFAPYGGGYQPAYNPTYGGLSGHQAAYDPSMQGSGSNQRMQYYPGMMHSSQMPPGHNAEHPGWDPSMPVQYKKDKDSLDKSDIE